MYWILYILFILIELVETNVALHKPCQQAGIRFGFPATNAVDGNRNGRLFGKSCIHTTDVMKPWWRVDLLDQYLVHRVDITNRQDCCGRLFYYLCNLVHSLFSNFTTRSKVCNGSCGAACHNFISFSPPNSSHELLNLRNLVGISLRPLNYNLTCLSNS